MKTNRLSDMEVNARRMGLSLPDHFRKQLKRSETDDVFEYIPENIDGINLFFWVQDQWIMGPGGPVGINLLAAIQVTQPLADGTVICPVDDVQEALADVKAIAGKIMEIWARRKK